MTYIDIYMTYIRQKFGNNTHLYIYIYMFLFSAKNACLNCHEDDLVGVP